jgi:Domain of unknown function (DUF4082)/Fibronectin type III domain
MSLRSTRGLHGCRFVTRRSSRPRIDHLESRAMLSTVVVHPTFVLAPLGGGPPAGTYAPAQIQQAYGFNSILFNGTPGTGKGETIAIVDAYDDPKIQSDLNTFDSQFGVAATTVFRVNQTGGTSYPTSDSSGGWELEESLDVEWAHAMAPQASIMLVEASSASDTDLLAAVKYAAAHANVVSMSWGGGEFSGETAYDSAYFAKAGVVFVASSGDSGAPASWPAASPNVVSVGGTALTLGAGNAWSSEVGWSGSGGGPSTSESQPSYQKGVVTQTLKSRGTPDVAYDGSPSTGFAVYDSVPYSGTTYGWLGVGGTSAGAPQWAAIFAIADQGRASSGQPAINSTNPQEVMNVLYKNPGDFHDIVGGTSVGQPHYSAGIGYDYVTGLGSPIANLVVGSFVSTSTTPPDKLVLAATTSLTAGASFSVTLTALNSSGVTDTGYLGTVHFTSGDVLANLPADYTFTAVDHGSHTFTLTMKTAGGQSLSATDTTNSAINGTLTGITVSPAAASQYVLSGLTSTATVGVAQSVTVTAEDPYGNVATGYAGTVQFTSSDTAASLPSNYTFNTANQGVNAFTFTFGTAGTQSLSVSDVTAQFTATQSGITVAPATPINLVASAVSSTQINLTWTGSNGATGYLIQQSTSGTTAWTQVGSTSGGTSTSFQKTGLSAGTTYYYRVLATSGNVDSNYSNVATATTTGAPATAGSIWSNSYVPHENAYSYGSYEVGVKFTSSVSGEATGARFYKETSMGGYLHVGHLWSPTGALLASATFTNESASGWQQVTFASPVAIQANAVYVVSFSTGGGYFGITTNFFTSGGVSNGSLKALPSSVTGGDGVYNRAGAYPNVNGSGMNFWADVAFVPSSSGSSIAKSPSLASSSNATGGFGISALTTSGQSNRLVTLAPQATPAGPAGYLGGSRGTTSIFLGSLFYRRAIPQGATIAPFLKNSWWALGSSSV